jgi:predicted secreted hydrolase
VAFATLGWAAVGSGAAGEVPARDDGFAVPRPGEVFRFPRDHGSHPEFRLEWWYVTGHLWDGASNRFGFQATFFRRAAPRSAVEAGLEPPAFGTSQLHLAHMALVEPGSGRFWHQERLNREGWDAGASVETLDVRNGNWSLRLAPRADSDRERLLLRGTVRGEVGWELSLEAIKPLVVFGTNGVSRKGSAPAAASHYLTWPRLRVEGRLTVEGAERGVRGLAWMDHEFSSSQLAEEQAGWDWASVQLADGREIMCYRMRRKDGGTDPFSTLAWVDETGGVVHVGADAFQLEALGRWRSPRSGAVYPLGFRLAAPEPGTGRRIELRLEPLASDQELSGGIGGTPYWEGACRVVGRDGAEVGWAYVELTGYAGDLGARLR